MLSRHFPCPSSFVCISVFLLLFYFRDDNKHTPFAGSMFRPVVTTTAPVNAIVTNSLYQPQQQQTFVAQNHLPKIGAIKATTLGVSNPQQKVLNIVAPQKHTTTTTTTTIQNTNTVQHIKTGNNVLQQQQQQHHQPTPPPQQQRQQHHHPIIQNGTNINTTTDNIINTTPVASQIISNTIQSPAIHTEAIKSEALVTSSSIDSKSATTINTNAHAQTPITANNNTTHVNHTTNRTQHTNSVLPNSERKEQSPTELNSSPAPTPPVVDQPINENNDDENEPEPEIDIVINNVVCSFSVRCHLNLREIALNGRNVEFRRENGMVTMKLRRPYTTASIWSSGRITCTGATSEDQVCFVGI